MEFSVNSKILLSHLNIAAGAIGKNPVLPIMEDFLFELSGNSLKVVATDLETTIISKIDVDGKKDGSIAIPANTILQTLKTMNDIVLTISLDETNVVEIVSLTGNYKCSGDHPNDFPNPPEKIDVQEISIESESLRKGINSALFATSNDELRLAMTGLFMNIVKDGLFIVATDAHKLVEYHLKGDFNVESEIGVIIPNNSCKNIESILGSSETINISVNKNNAFFETDSTVIITRLIDAKYPQYKSVIPQDNSIYGIVNRKDVIGSLKRALIYANKSTNQVIFTYTGNKLDINTTDIDMGKEANESLSVELLGADSFDVGYNAKFVLEMLSVIEQEKIEFKMKSRSSATIIDIETDKDNTKFLLMPVMIGN